ncbi:hypothetical protein N825_12180 [Skermanella stibiiresistens SB22]|uniref:Mce/MlaD domain-containing protein n=1 Tax=Skermanella stibiiresistens SB22 TaxID=1385369 RepID=W9H1G5_9PROT|nr:MlaD family protein [Skermanella stibiiresistens]EWY38562.1 hypothetical protein N825_12180 [Skermanella stibiiresistens SB22]
MTDRNRDGGTVTPAAEPVRQRRTLPLIWIVPLVAAVIGGWLIWTTVSDRGPMVTITFETAEGIEAGKTKVKYKAVDVGTVESVTVSEDLGHVVVTARMVKQAAAYLTTGSRFWVVKPRLGSGGVSGLTTIVSGSYIGIDPGSGEGETSFTGLEEPPLVQTNTPGRRFLLTSTRLGGLAPGVPIYYAGIQVGEVLGYEFTENWSELHIPVFVHAPYDKLVRPNSRFWNTSGIEVSYGPDGPALSIESLQTLVTGGVAFDTPGIENPSASAEEGTSYPLFANQRSVEASRYTRKLPFLAHFDGSVRGLRPGSPVEFRGIRIGQVTDVKLAWDQASNSVRIPVTFEIEPERIDSAPVPSDPAEASADYARVDELVRRGLRAQVQTGNILTGELVVALDLFPGSPQTSLDTAGPIPELPTEPNVLDTATRSLTGLMESLSKAPIGETVEELRAAVHAAGTLLGGPETARAVASLSSTMVELDKTMRTVSGEAAPMIRALRQASESVAAIGTEAEATLKSTNRVIGSAAPVIQDMNGLMRELATAARSIRVFADYLERHPEALIQGKR